MDDPQAPPAGTRGTIITVDDLGDLVVAWDNGCGLNVLPGVDRVRIITEEQGRCSCGRKVSLGYRTNEAAYERLLEIVTEMTMDYIDAHPELLEQPAPDCGITGTSTLEGGMVKTKNVRINRRRS